MKLISKISLAAAIFFVPTSGFLVCRYLRHESLIENLGEQSSTMSKGPLVPQDAVTAARWERFNRIWKTRNQRDIIALIAPFLSDDFAPLRVRAVLSLGRLENPKGLRPLKELLKKVKSPTYTDKKVPIFLIELAIGRINSRGFVGQKKIVAMVGEIGLTWPDLVKLSKKVNGQGRDYMNTGSSNYIIKEVIDVIYTLGKSGHPVLPIYKQLTLLPHQQFIVESSSLSYEKECILTIDYFLSRKIVTLDDYDLVDHFVEIGPIATTAIINSLKDIKRNPAKFRGIEPYPGHPGMYRKRNGYSIILRTAAKTGDKRVIPLLKEFQLSPNKDISDEATLCLEFINVRTKMVNSAPN